MSDFIENSKHAEMTAAVESHFGTAKKRSLLGDADGKGFPRGGSTNWNGTPMPFPAESGVNYTPPGSAGHDMTGSKPFSGQADGMPGSAKKLW